MSKYIKLLESELEKAEITLAVRDVSDRLQKMASELSRMTVDDIPAVVERIKASHGIEVGNKFSQTITDQLNSLIQNILNTKSSIDDEALVISGDASPSDLSVPNDMENEPEIDMEVEDEPSDETEDETEDEISVDIKEPSLGRRVKENREFDEDGRGKFKVNYTFPDKKEIGNDKFETKGEAIRFAKSLKSKGYHDVSVSDGGVIIHESFPIIVKKLLESCDCEKKKETIKKMYKAGSAQKKQVMELAKKLNKRK